MSQIQLPILVVEDSPEDYEATVRAFQRAGFANPIYHVTDGDAALDFVHQRGAYAEPQNAPRPAIVLLDLNLPGTDGREVLGEMKRDERLKAIPVVVLTTSSDQGDVEKCYLAGANSYITKPVDLEGLVKSIQNIKEYWFEVVILPAAI